MVVELSSKTSNALACFGGFLKLSNCLLKLSTKTSHESNVCYTVSTCFNIGIPQLGDFSMVQSVDFPIVPVQVGLQLLGIDLATAIGVKQIEGLAAATGQKDCSKYLPKS